MGVGVGAGGVTGTGKETGFAGVAALGTGMTAGGGWITWVLGLRRGGAMVWGSGTPVGVLSFMEEAAAGTRGGGATEVVFFWGASGSTMAGISAWAGTEGGWLDKIFGAMTEPVGGGSSLREVTFGPDRADDFFSGDCTGLSGGVAGSSAGVPAAMTAATGF
jgi:hypothetical protein